MVNKIPNFNPELFTIKERVAFGISSPGDVTSIGLWPYINRLKKDKIKILDFGVMKGECARHLLELDVNNKIEKVYGIPSYSGGFYARFMQIGNTNYTEQVENVLRDNTKGYPKISLDYDGSEVDVLCVEADSVMADGFDKYYPKLAYGGIVCGNDHRSIHVKEALVEFRKKFGIRDHINVSRGSWFWIKKQYNNQ